MLIFLPWKSTTIISVDVYHIPKGRTVFVKMVLDFQGKLKTLHFCSMLYNIYIYMFRNHWIMVDHRAVTYMAYCTKRSNRKTAICSSRNACDAPLSCCSSSHRRSNQRESCSKQPKSGPCVSLLEEQHTHTHTHFVLYINNKARSSTSPENQHEIQRHRKIEWFVFPFPKPFEVEMWAFQCTHRI